MAIKCIFNDQLLDQDRASVKLTDLALLRGYGVFDFFRLQGSVPLFIDEHLERFYRSCALLHLDPPVSADVLRKKILELLSANRLPDSGVRIVLTGGESPNGYFPGTPTLFVLNEPISLLSADAFSNGIKLISEEYQRDLPEIKSINYLMGIFKLPQLRASGAADVLYHFKGRILEVTRSNFFIVDKKGSIITANKDILMGINRGKLIECAREEFQVEEREVAWEELKTAREAFITGTTKKVTPVIQVDDLVIGDGKPGKITKRLQVLYDNRIQQYVDGHQEQF